MAADAPTYAEEYKDLRMTLVILSQELIARGRLMSYVATEHQDPMVVTDIAHLLGQMLYECGKIRTIVASLCDRYKDNFSKDFTAEAKTIWCATSLLPCEPGKTMSNALVNAMEKSASYTRPGEMHMNSKDPAEQMLGLVMALAADALDSENENKEK